MAAAPIPHSQAGAGYREVDVPGGLIDALAEWKARTPCPEPDDPVFVSRNGRRQTVTNVDHRLKTAIKAANKRLAQSGIDPISERVSPHSLRRTYASLRAALRDDPVYIAEQLGHTDPAFTFRVYQKAAKRRERLSGEYLAAFDRACQWALLGTGTAPAPIPAGSGSAVQVGHVAFPSHNQAAGPCSSAG